MSFDKLNRYKQQVKAVQRKPNEPETVAEVVPEKSERKAILNVANGTEENQPNATPDQAQSNAVQQQPAPTKEDMKFNEADSEKNIIFMDQKELKTLQSELDPNTAAQTTNEIPQIKGATIYKLIERASTEKYADPNLLTDFLLTFRSFTTPRQLLTLLIKRYHMPVPKDLSYGELQEWKQNTLKPIRLRLINFLKTWLEKYWKDFTEDPEMSAKLHEFLLEDVVSTGFQNFADQLTKTWDKKKSNPDQDRNFVFGDTPPKPFLPKMNKGGSTSALGLLDFHSEEIARQLTLMEFTLYRNIKAWEFFNQAWTRKNKETTSANVLKMIKRFNEVSTWVSTEIVRTEKLKDRIGVLSKFLEIADKCRALNNFNAVMEIISGLQSSSVFRLKQTWNGLPSKQKELFEELKELMSRAQNFAKLRKHIKGCNPPLIPYLGLYLTDLTFIEDGNPDLIEGGLINWVKRRRLANVIKDIQQYQQKPYCLEEVSFMQEYLLNYVPLTEDEAYKMSLQRETRTPDKEPKKPLFAISKKENKEKQPSPQTQPKEQKATKTASVKPEEEEPDDEEFEIQYKAGYKFFDKDSEQNIIVEKDPKGEMNDVIIAGTLPKLVERLTYEKYPDVNYMTSFLLTFRTFVSQHELLDLLQMRFHIPPPVDQSAGALEKFKQLKETPIQLRVFNVCRSWVEKYFDDFREDKTLLTKMLEFVDKSMLPSPTLGRGGQNLKAQIGVKLESKDEKKAAMFDKEPPLPILPSVDNPTLLDYSPEELARQMTLIDYDLFTSIKPLEYLYLNKPSSWVMNAEETSEEEPENLKSSPHVVAVVYRFTDIRDWVATEVMKMINKEARVKVIDHFIQVAQKCVALNNFHTFVSIVSALNLECILNLKSTWKLLPKQSLDAFIQLRDLMSYRQNYKALRDKFLSIAYPAIPYIGLYVQDLGSIKEQMPDTIEPGSFINFAKRQKMANLIQEIFNFQQTPYNLKVVPSIQDYLKQLDIYDMNEMKVLSEQYQEADGDKAITEDIFAKPLETKDPRSNSGSSKTPLNADMRSISGVGTIGKSLSSSHSPRSSVANLAALVGTPETSSPRTSVSSGTGNSNVSGSPRGSPSPSVSTNVNVSQQPQPEVKAEEPPHPANEQATKQETTTAVVTPTASPVSSPTPEPKAETPAPATVTPAPTPVTPVAATTPAPTPVTPAPATTPVATPVVAATPAPTPVTPAPVVEAKPPAPVLDAIDLKLLKVFPGSKIADWKATDSQGTIYGWSGEEIVAKVITRNSDVFLVPLFSPTGNARIDKAELSLCIRIGQFYEAQTKQKPTKVLAFALQVADGARPIASRVGMQVIISPP